MVKKYIPQQGDIIWITFDPTRGHEQKGMRPALVLSPRAYNKISQRMIVCPITSTQKGYPFEVVIESKHISGVVLVDQVRTLNWSARGVTFITRAESAVVKEVSLKLRVLIEV